MEDTSCFLSHILDKIGYGPEMVRFRRKVWKRYADIENSMKYHTAKRHLILAGSKSEGITSFYENDIDHMFVSMDVICVEEVDRISDSADLSVFQTNMHNTPPGYTKLKLEQLNQEHNANYLRDSLFRGADSHTYISSAFYMEEQRKELQRGRSGHEGVIETAGPAFPVSAGSLKADIVSGFFYNRPNSLQLWSRRRRQHQWPSSDVIEGIATGHGQVVPIGCYDSDTQFQEWRVCFVDSELKLLQTLSHTHIKLYVLLKLIAKHVLKDVSQNITSYVVKNVCFWMAELLPADTFRDGTLVPLLLYSLAFLRRCIFDWNYLPYYMIPERNLIAGKFKTHERQQLASLLTELVLEGPRLLLRCPKIQQAMLIMYGIPEQLTAYSEKRNELEILKLRHTVLSIAKQYGGDTGDAEGTGDTEGKGDTESKRDTDRKRDTEHKRDTDTEGAGDLCNSLRLKIADIVLPKWKVLRRQGVDVNAIIMERLQQFLS